jgi:pheromone shutdown protein TraB
VLIDLKVLRHMKEVGIGSKQDTKELAEVDKRDKWHKKYFIISIIFTIILAIILILANFIIPERKCG